MKKKILNATILAVSACVLIIGCKKEDTTAPVIALIGDNPQVLNLGDTWAEPGYTATDDEDGDIKSSVTVSGSVNTSEVGEYTLTYSVSDAAGNAASSQTRTVRVKSDKLAGLYNVQDVVTGPGAGTYNYAVTVTQSSSDYNKVLISNFGGFGSSVVVNATVEGSVITIASQQPAGMPIANTTVSGTGSYDGDAFKITTINYSAVYPGGAGTDNSVATFTKQ